MRQVKVKGTLQKMWQNTETSLPQGPNAPVVSTLIGSSKGYTQESYAWRPQRNISDFNTIILGNRVRGTLKKITPKSGTTVIKATTSGIPQSVFNVSAAQSPLKVQNKTVSQITVTFSRNPNDTVYDHVNIWVKGYQGNNNFVEYASAVNSPANFFLESNGNVVTVALQAVSGNNQISAPITACPMSTVTLSGVVSNPPAPTITQTLVAIPLGYQFTFTQVQLAAGTEDVIKSYKVYRNSSNTFAGATVIQVIADNGKNDGSPVVVQDQQTGGSVFYYFITSVNTAGLESSSSSAQAGTVNSGLVNSRSTVAATNSAITTSSTAILTQSGTTTTINVASFTVQYPFGQVTYNSGSVNPGAYGTYSVYFSDPNFTGGAVSYSASTAPYQTNASDSSVAIGVITTAGGGGGSGGGGGGGGGGNICFLPDVRLRCGRIISSIKAGDLVWTLKGIRSVREIHHNQYMGEIYHMGDDEWVTANHAFVVGGIVKPACELWTEHKYYEGLVCNLEISTDKEEERNYFLKNGMLSHNTFMVC